MRLRVDATQLVDTISGLFELSTIYTIILHCITNERMKHLLTLNVSSAGILNLLFNNTFMSGVFKIKRYKKQNKEAGKTLNPTLFFNKKSIEAESVFAVNIE